MARIGLGENWRCLLANDFDPVKTATYRANFADAQDHLRQGDVFALGEGDLPGEADLAWASSPCQDFSLAGGRAGLEGGRSSAFFGFWRLMRAIGAQGRGPRVIVIENVVGLLTSHDGARFQAVCRALADEGYRFGALEIDAVRLHAAVAASRIRRGQQGAMRRPGGRQRRSTASAVRAAHARLPETLRQAWVWWRLDGPARRNTDLAAMLEPDLDRKWRTAEQTAVLLDMMDERHRARVEAAAQAGERVVGAVFRRMRGGSQRAEVRFDGLAGCVRTPRGGSSRQILLVVENGRVRSRWLTAREGARLMGLSDDYRLPGSESAGLACHRRRCGGAGRASFGGKVARTAAAGPRFCCSGGIEFLN